MIRLARLILLIGLLAGRARGTDPPEALLTMAERSDFRATARHDDVLNLCRALAARSDSVHLGELGRSHEGRSIPLLIVAQPGITTPEACRKSGKTRVLLIGNIHAGEVCGKEALLMLVRELTQTPGHPLLNNLVLAVVPNFNPDGNERVSKDNRPGQNGPEDGIGQRANAQGLDLNRDFVKLESPEVRSLVRFLNLWDPHLMIDTHTTNGSLHRYVLTYQGPQNPAGHRRVLDHVRYRLLPAVDEAFERSTGWSAFFYGNFERDHTLWTGFPDLPRFGTNYVGMRDRIGILSEAYAYAPYRDRVLATLGFVRCCLEYAAGHAGELGDLLDSARADADAEAVGDAASVEVALASEPRAFPEPVTVLGHFEERHEDGRLVAGEPRDYRVEVLQDYRPTRSVTRPYAYVIPNRFETAIDTLRRHGVIVERLTENITLDTVAYRIGRVDRASRAFEGHRTVTLEVTRPDRPLSRRVEKGTVLVRTAQPLGRLAVYLLEPASSDGLATWNSFDEDLFAGGVFPVFRVEHAPAHPIATVPLDLRADQ